MLVLSRRKNETIHIGDDITITVTEIRGDKVRLGIDAPKDVPIVRDDVPDAIKKKINLEPTFRALQESGNCTLP